MTSEERKKLEELNFERDCAAYSVVGCARVLFELVNDPEMRQSGLDAIAAYDRRHKALEDFKRTLREQPKVGTL